MPVQSYIYCHRPSASANVLARAISRAGVRTKRLYGLKAFRTPLPIINWGCPTTRYPLREVLNQPQAVANAISKQRTIKLLEDEDVPHVRITQDEKIARDWIRKGHRVLKRRDGLSEGRGIEMYHPEERASRPFDFYAKVFPKTHEFRVHVVRGVAVDVVEKKARRGIDENRIIRTHGNGWIFAHENLSLTDQRDIDSVCKLACDACAAVGLDFGAVDVLCVLAPGNPRRLQRSVVCEVNTAPGLEAERTIQAYARRFAAILGERA